MGINDDAAFLRMIMKKILEDIGLKGIGEAADGYDAIEAYKTLKPDLVTMDMTMPHMNGLDALKSGGVRFITKPFSEEHIKTVSKHIEHIC